MEKLIFKVKDLEDALATLKQAFSVQDKVAQINDNTLILAAQDSLIKRFEYSFDCFWKVLKLYLEKKLNLEDVNSPKSVFHACVKHGLLTEQEGGIAIVMVGDRNETSHNYDQAKADQIADNIKSYYDLMLTITTRIKANVKN